MTPVCDTVVISCPQGAMPGKVVGRTVEAGSLGGCAVRSCTPSCPCTAAHYTRVVVSHVADVKVVDEEDYKVVYVREGGSVRHFVYPKDVWDKVAEYIERLRDGLPPKTPGLLLHGPPGTGKTSMAEIVSLAAGVDFMEVTPTSVLSKYVGESEKALQRIFDDFMGMGRGVLIIDDAEWVLTKRQLAAEEEAVAGGTAVVERNLVHILLRNLVEVRRSGLPLLVVATTNVSISTVDPALLREERFGKPIFVPLPDYKAFKIYLREAGMGEQDADRAARYLASHGANFDDARRYVEEWREGKEFRLESYRGRGYVRVAPEAPLHIEIDSRTLDELMRRLRLTPSMFSDKRTRAAYAGPTRFWLPILNELSVRFGRGSIFIDNPRFIDEAIMTAEEGGQAIIAPASLLGYDYVQYLNYRAEAPVFFVLSEQDLNRNVVPEGVPVRISAQEFLRRAAAESKDVALAVAAIVLSFYNVRYTERSLRALYERLVSQQGAGALAAADRFVEFVAHVGHARVADDVEKLDVRLVDIVAR